MGAYLSSCDKTPDESGITTNVKDDPEKPNFVIIKTVPFKDQKCTEHGLIKKTKVFMQEHYVHNFVQSVLNLLDDYSLKNGCLLIASDGRYYSEECIQIICEVAAANGIQHFIIPKNGIATTSGCSSIILNRNKEITKVENEKKTIVNNAEEPVVKKCIGGFVLSAFQEEGGDKGYFGIKVLRNKGEIADEEFIDKMYQESVKINNIKVRKLKAIKTNEIKTYQLENVTIEVIDGVKDWLDVMKSIFDFNLIRKLTENKKFVFAYDAFHGATAEYAKELFVKELKLSDKYFYNLNRKKDFNKLKPMPNVTNAKKLVRAMKLDEQMKWEEEEEEREKNPDGKREVSINFLKQCSSRSTTDDKDDEDLLYMGVACDVSGESCMILAKRLLISSGESLAAIAHYADKCIPFLKENFVGIARSVQTSKAVDYVASSKNIHVYETPESWKSMSNLLGKNKVSICGGESIGFASGALRERDALFIILCWLSILSYRNNVEKYAHQTNYRSGIISMKDTMQELWKQYGRCYSTTYFFEVTEEKKCDQLFDFLDKLVTHKLQIYEEVKELNPTDPNHRIHIMENFTYVDDVTKSVSTNQGIRICFENDVSIVYKKIKSESCPSTIKIHFQKYEKENIMSYNRKVLKNVIHLGLKICKIQEFIGTDVPAIII